MTIAELDITQYKDVDMNAMQPAEQEQFISLLLRNSIKAKVVSFYAKNFLAHVDSTVYIDPDINVTSLVGYNDNCKTGLSYVFNVIFYDSFRNQQTEMIHDSNGSTFFDVGITFSDGVTLQKIKMATGESIWYMKHNDFIIYTNQKSNSIISTEGVPYLLQKYLKVSEVEKERINIRRNTEKLFLVNTSPGDNTKIIYTLLNLDDVSETQSILNKARNTMLTQLGQKEYTRKNIAITLSRMELMTTGEEDSLLYLAEKSQNQVDRLVEINSVYVTRKKLEESNTHENIPQMDIERVKILKALVDLRGTLVEKPQEQIEYLDYSKYKELAHLVSLRQKLNEDKPPIIEGVQEVERQLNKVAELRQILALRSVLDVKENTEQLESLSTAKLQALLGVQALLEGINNSKQNLEAILEEKRQLEEISKQLVAKYDLRVCNNCGELSIMTAV